MQLKLALVAACVAQAHRLPHTNAKAAQVNAHLQPYQGIEALLMHNLAQVGDKNVDLEVQVDVEKTHEDGSSEAVHVEGSLDGEGDGD